jgi:NAD(P)-dependent dehydrogenase (short-subunit alcohol dehydrogenase family)
MQGRVTLVSGASRGLARGVVEGFFGEGGVVHVVGRDLERLGGLVELLGEGCVHVGDLNEVGVAQRVVGEVLEVQGRLDGLVLGVGPYHAGALSGTCVDDWSGLWAGNVQCGIHLFDAARSALRDASGAALFFGAAGLGGLQARRTTAAYTAVKTALLSYMVSLAKEEAEFGVRVNMVSPGVIPHGGASVDTNSSETWKQIPMGRPGEVRDVVDAALWLMGPGARYVTGQNLEVAGGFLL